MLKFATSERCRPDGKLTPGGNREAKKQRIHSDRTCRSIGDVSVDLAFKQYNALKKAHDDFDSFVEVVSKDMNAKTACLRKMKNSSQVGLSERTEANVQLFMLSQYSHRITRFRAVANESLYNICKKIAEKENVDDLVEKHKASIAKMKRRMKQMLDVAEKYAVEDIFDTINLLQQMSNKINLAPIDDDEGRSKRLNRRSHSMSTLGIDVDVPLASRCNLPPLSPNPLLKEDHSNPVDLTHLRKMNSFKSFSDHLAVLTKTYTSRR